MTLIDTSAWIEFFRGRSPLADEVDALVAHKEAAICGPIMTELRRGFVSVAERRKVLPLLGACHALPQPSSLWEDAGDLGFALARAGVSCKSFNLLIATYALAHSVPLLAGDRDYLRIQGVVGLVLA